MPYLSLETKKVRVGVGVNLVKPWAQQYQVFQKKISFIEDTGLGSLIWDTLYIFICRYKVCQKMLIRDKDTVYVLLIFRHILLQHNINAASTKLTLCFLHLIYKWKYLFQLGKGSKKNKINYGKFHIGSWPPPPPPCYGKKNFIFFSDTRPYFENFL